MIDSLRSRIRAVSLIARAFVIALVLFTGAASGQATITPNYKDAEDRKSVG